ncbi:hypothetical protein KO465_01115 [Candidatus Micrarchaeota archaeon]|nr:hypothetical protein [Candidatus Micrarchaeota archaeon]
MKLKNSIFLLLFLSTVIIGVEPSETFYEECSDRYIGIDTSSSNSRCWDSMWLVKGPANRYLILKMSGLSLDKIKYSDELLYSHSHYEETNFQNVLENIRDSSKEYDNAYENYAKFKNDYKSIFPNLCAASPYYDSCLEANKFYYFIDTQELEGCMEAFESNNLNAFSISSDTSSGRVKASFDCLGGLEYGTIISSDLSSEIFTSLFLDKMNGYYDEAYTSNADTISKLVSSYNSLHLLNSRKASDLADKGILDGEYNSTLQEKYKQNVRELYSMSTSPECNSHSLSNIQYNNVYYSSQYFYASSMCTPATLTERPAVGHIIYDYYFNVLDFMGDVKKSDVAKMYPLVFSRVILYNLVSDNGLLVREIKIYKELADTENEMFLLDKHLETNYQTCESTTKTKKEQLEKQNLDKINIFYYVNSGILKYPDNEIYDYNGEIEEVNEAYSNMTDKAAIASSTSMAQPSYYSLRYKNYNSAILNCRDIQNQINKLNTRAQADLNLFDTFVSNKIKECQNKKSNADFYYMSRRGNEKCQEASDVYDSITPSDSYGDKFVKLESAYNLAVVASNYYDNSLSDDDVIEINYLLGLYKTKIDCAKTDGVLTNITSIHTGYYNIYAECVDPDKDITFLDCFNIQDKIALKINELDIAEGEANLHLIERYTMFQTNFTNPRILNHLPLSFQNSKNNLDKYFNGNDFDYNVVYCNMKNIESEMNSIELEWETAKKQALSESMGETSTVYVFGESPVLDKKTCTSVELKINNPTNIEGRNVIFFIDRDLDILSYDFDNISSSIEYIRKNQNRLEIKMKYVNAFDSFTLTANRCELMVWTISKTIDFDYISASSGKGNINLKIESSEAPLDGAKIYISIPETSLINSARFNSVETLSELIGSGSESEALFQLNLIKKTPNQLSFNIEFASPIETDIRNKVISDSVVNPSIKYDLIVSDATFVFSKTKIVVTDAEAGSISNFAVTDNLGKSLTTTTSQTTEGTMYSFNVDSINPSSTYTYHVSYTINNLVEYVLSLRESVGYIVNAYGTTTHKQTLSNIDSLINQNKHKEALPLLLDLKYEIEEHASKQKQSKQIYDDEIEETAQKLKDFEEFNEEIVEHGFEDLDQIQKVKDLLEQAKQAYESGDYKTAADLLRQAKSLMDIDYNQYLSDIMKELLLEFETLKTDYYSMEIYDPNVEELIEQIHLLERELRGHFSMENLSNLKEKINDLNLLLNQIKSSQSEDFLTEIAQFKQDVLDTTVLMGKYKQWHNDIHTKKTVGGSPLYSFPITPSKLEPYITKSQTLVTKLDKYENDIAKLKTEWATGQNTKNLFYQQKDTLNKTIQNMESQAEVYLTSGTQRLKICEEFVAEKGLEAQYSSDLTKIQNVLDQGSDYLSKGDYGNALLYTYTGMAAAEALSDELSREKSNELDITLVAVGLTTLIIVGLIVYFVFGKSGGEVSLFNRKQEKEPAKKTLKKNN